MFQPCDRCLFSQTALVDVICQLRFPTILSIGVRAPDAFQDAIRKEFPRYEKKLDQPAPKLTGIGTPTPQVQKPEPVVNHNFLSADGAVRLNLTSSFIALSSYRYPRWEVFAKQLDFVLSEFLRIYEPAYFERIGLRYINAFSRRELGLVGTPWRELIAPTFLGLMEEDDLREEQFSRCSQDAELKIPGGCRLKLHSGPGLLARNNVKDEEIRYVLDLDVSMPGQIQLPHVTGALQSVHVQADTVFRSALLEPLTDAMGQTAL